MGHTGLAHKGQDIVEYVTDLNCTNRQPKCLMEELDSQNLLKSTFRNTDLK